MATDGLLDRDRGAVGAQLVGDALLVERGGHLAGVRRREAGGERRVGRRGREPQHEEHDPDDGEGGDADDDLGSRRQLEEGVGESASVRGSDLCVEEVLGRLDDLVAHLGGELHGELRALDGHDDLGGVLDGAGGERLRARRRRPSASW